MTRLLRITGGIGLPLVLALSAPGCGGGGDTVAVQFPDINTLPKPIIGKESPPSSKIAEPISQGDPGSYSR